MKRGNNSRYLWWRLNSLTTLIQCLPKLSDKTSFEIYAGGFVSLVREGKAIDICQNS